METLKDDLFIKAAQVFGKDTLFMHDCIKQIMRKNGLNPRDKNLQKAFIEVAIGVALKNYPPND